MDQNSDDNDDELKIEDFAARYSIVHGVRVFSWTGDVAGMDVDLYNGLVERMSEPLIGRVGGLTYEFAPVGQVPANSVNVPAEEHNGTTPETVLIQKEL